VPGSVIGGIGMPRCLRKRLADEKRHIDADEATKFQDPLARPSFDKLRTNRVGG